MKRFAVVIVFAFIFLAGCASTTKYVAMSEKADDYIVTTDFLKKPPIVGENTLLISIKDKSGKEIPDADVRVDYFMTEKRIPGKAYVVAMRAHGSSSNGEARGADYNAKLYFTMSGPWHINVVIIRDGKAQIAQFHTVL